MPDAVQLFITCIVDTFYPEIGESIVNVFRRLGVQVEFPQGQTCCGQPAFNAGMNELARQLAMHSITVFESSHKGAVVTPSGSCASMIRHNYPKLFARDPIWGPRAKTLAARTYEFTEYLVDVLGVVDVGARYSGTIAYHASCHLLRELGVDRQPRTLLRHVKDAELVELEGSQECCGFGGVFSIEHPEISTAMLERKIANFEISQADMLVTCDAGCVTNINGGLHRRGLPARAVHIAQVLDNA